MARRPDRLGRTRFNHEYETTAKSLRDTLRKFLGKPDETNIHNLRTSLRRTEASIDVIAKKARKRDPSIERYNERCRKLFKATSPIRDLDIVLRALGGQASDPSVGALMRGFRLHRKKLLERSMKPAWKLFETKHPKLETNALRGLDTHARAVLDKLDKRFNRELGRVVASESRVDDLHSLRKRCKMLRYTLELFPRSPPLDERFRLLRNWQDSLGGIRDSDVVIEHLARSQSSTVQHQIIQQEKVKRHAAYLKFVGSTRGHLGQRPSTGHPLR